MSKEFKLPDIGEGVHEGEVVKWMVKEGDSINVDQPLIEIMTDKATVEIPSPFAGKITGLKAKEGDMIKVGQTIVTYEAGGGAATAEKPAPSPAPKAPAAPPKQAPSQAQAKPSSPPWTTAPASPKSEAKPVSQPATAKSAPRAEVESYTASPGTVLATPATRRLARDLGVDLTQIPATGPNGRVTKEDLQKFSGVSAAGPQMPVHMPTIGSRNPSEQEVLIPFRGIRRKIAEAMSKSRTVIPEFTYVDECDFTELVAFRKEIKESAEKQGIKITFLPFIIKAMVQALRQYPQLNSVLDEAGGNIIQKHYYNFGIAVDTEEGLVVPVVKNAESKSILQIAAEIQTLADKARHRKLTANDMHGATITITNPGPIGGLITAPVINYPEVAILGVHKIVKRPVVKNDQIVIADMIYFSIAVDHRVVDGATAARFMNTMMDYLANPKKLILEMA